MQPWLSEVLSCPSCGGDLSAGPGGLGCGCGATYPVIDGIPVFVDDIDEASEPTNPAGEPPHIPAVRHLVRRHIGRNHLDVGCGTGRNLPLFEQRYIGCDPSLPSLLVARDRARRLEVDASFVCADGRDLPLMADTFDIVLASEVIEHVPPADRGAFSRELLRTTVPGGMAMVSAPARTALGDAIGRLARRLRLLDHRSGDDDHPRITVGELRSLGFEAHGCLDAPAHDALRNRRLGPVGSAYDRLAWRVPGVSTHVVGVRRVQSQSS